jgi:hypothetical protein
MAVAPQANVENAPIVLATTPNRARIAESVLGAVADICTSTATVKHLAAVLASQLTFFCHESDSLNVPRPTTYGVKRHESHLCDTNNLF